ncbi:N-acetyltransferase 9 isoform X3 [Zootermopsis nevadensis]|uniref:N-acetyltransferase 9 isoform X3 n=1 Tax=Zootermopsis nevadensis TaxID=136037 RepID=UPI000B8EC101|nr:N-acetyltransferase 9 isoform X3 [Zootermopsis nevadensis]
MKKNRFTQILGKNVILVPYKAEHVPKYHEWMKSPELQLLTASEPLSLSEEYEMQKSWLMDEDITVPLPIGAMIGDTNLFLYDSEDCTRLAEVEIMIAENNVRRKRRGWEAVLLMLRYGCEELAVEKFQAKINLDNNKSISMFQKIGFARVSESAVFKEVTLEKCVDGNWKHWLMEQTQESKCVQTGG